MDDDQSSLNDLLGGGDALSSVDQSKNQSDQIPKFDAPTPYQLNPSDSYSQSLHYGGLAADQATQTATNSLAETNAASQQAYANKMAINNQYAQQGKMQTGSAGDGSSSTFAFTTPNSGSGGGSNSSSSDALQSQIALNSNNRYNQSLIMGQQYQNQLGLQNAQDKSNEAIASTQAQGNILSSLFNSIGGQKYSSQYW
jgi:hypothetical protein